MPNDRLDGWKAIASYLHRDVRTCQRWEKELGLPVYRIDETSDRPKVYSFKSELDDWFKSGEKNRVLEEANRAGQRRIALFSFIIILGVVAMVVLLSVFGDKLGEKVLSRKEANPVQWEIRGTNLAFFDGEDRLLWLVQLNNPRDLADYYDDEEDEIAISWKKSELQRSRVDFADTDGDGKNEVLTVLMHEKPEDRRLALYDNTGKLIWCRPIEHHQEYEEGTIFNDFEIQKLTFDDIDRDGTPEILALWIHRKRFPSVFLVYDIEGNEVLRYSHTGILHFFRVVEFSGRKQVFLGGTNNLLGGDAVLVVVDCDKLRSGLAPPYDIPPDLREESEFAENYRPVNYTPAFQREYIRFKRNELSRDLGIKYLFVYDARAGNNEIFVTVNMSLGKLSSVHFSFDADFTLRRVQPSLDFQRDYETYLAEGITRKSLDEFKKECEAGVLFWHEDQSWQDRPVGSVQ